MSPSIRSHNIGAFCRPSGTFNTASPELCRLPFVASRHFTLGIYLSHLGSSVSAIYTIRQMPRYIVRDGRIEAQIQTPVGPCWPPSTPDPNTEAEWHPPLANPRFKPKDMSMYRSSCCPSSPKQTRPVKCVHTCIETGPNACFHLVLVQWYEMHPSKKIGKSDCAEARLSQQVSAIPENPFSRPLGFLSQAPSSWGLGVSEPSPPPNPQPFLTVFAIPFC